MKTLEKIQVLNSLDIDGLTDLSDKNAASCCGGFTPSRSDGSPGLVIYDRSLRNADGTDKPGGNIESERGPRIKLYAKVGQTISFADTILNDTVSNAISIKGLWQLNEAADGGGRSVQLGPDANIAQLDFVSGYTGKGGPGFFDSSLEAGEFNDIFSSATRLA